MQFRNRVIVFIVAFVSAILESWASPLAIDTVRVVRQLEEQLAKAASAADSTKILYNLYDIYYNEPAKSFERLWELYRLAGREGDTPTRLDMMRNLTNMYMRNDSILSGLEQDCLREPTSNEQAETLLFIRINRMWNHLRFANEDERQAMLNEMMKRVAEPRDEDIYDQVLNTFTVVLLLQGETNGDLLAKYLDKLSRLVEKLPIGIHGIRNRVYIAEAIAYTANGNHEKAVEADRKMLDIVKRMEDEYVRAGRPYRTFGRNRYIIYRRMLSNYPAITPQEAETYYREAVEVGRHNYEVASDMHDTHMVPIYYYMKMGRYAEAIPLLKEAIPHATDFYQRRFMMEQLRKAAEAIGDESTLVATTMDYNRMLEEYISHKSAERYRELEIIYEVNGLRESNSELKLEREQGRLRDYRTALIVGAIALLVVMGLAVVLLQLWRRQRRLAEELKISTSKVIEERDELLAAQQSLIEARDEAKAAKRQREEFISNMSHEVTNPLRTLVEYSNIIVDCIDDSQHAYLERFGEIVNLNADLLQTIFSDMLSISSLTEDGARLEVKLKPTSLNRICRLAVDSSLNRLHPGVEMVYDQASEPDRMIVTDENRVEMELINLLQNAAKFTDEGRITLSYTINPGDASAQTPPTITFAVTDTGIGIPDGKEEQIFERFGKLDKYTQGIGLGLPICRLIAEMLKGSIRVDTDYRGGARFLFTIPISGE